jgi:hypothetical protein
MATRKPKIEDNADLVQDLDQFRRPQTQEIKLEPRKGRSRRGVTRDDPNTRQICFRVPIDTHTALKVYCARSNKEVGEVMDDLLTKFLRSLPSQGL